jgi:hypothetical protein
MMGDDYQRVKSRPASGSPPQDGIILVADLNTLTLWIRIGQRRILWSLERLLAWVVRFAIDSLSWGLESTASI